MNRGGRCGTPVRGCSKSRWTALVPSTGSAASTPNRASRTQERTRFDFHHLTDTTGVRVCYCYSVQLAAGSEAKTGEGEQRERPRLWHMLTCQLNQRLCRSGLRVNTRWNTSCVRGSAENGPQASAIVPDHTEARGVMEEGTPNVVRLATAAFAEQGVRVRHVPHLGIDDPKAIERTTSDRSREGQADEPVRQQGHVGTRLFGFQVQTTSSWVNVSTSWWR